MNRTKEEIENMILAVWSEGMNAMTKGGHSFDTSMRDNGSVKILMDYILICQAENEGKFTKGEIMAALHKAELQHGKDYSGIWTNMLLFLQSLKK